MNCPYCRATALPINVDDPRAWIDQEDGMTSLHLYQCIVYTDHRFYLETCNP